METACSAIDALIGGLERFRGTVEIACVAVLQVASDAGGALCGGDAAAGVAAISAFLALQIQWVAVILDWADGHAYIVESVFARCAFYAVLLEGAVAGETVLVAESAHSRRGLAEGAIRTAR